MSLPSSSEVPMIEPHDRVRHPALLDRRHAERLRAASARRSRCRTRAPRSPPISALIAAVPRAQAPRRLHQIPHLPVSRCLLWEWSPQALPPTPSAAGKGHKRFYPRHRPRARVHRRHRRARARCPASSMVEKYSYGAFHATPARADAAVARCRVARRHRHGDADLRRGDGAPGLSPRLSGPRW